MLNFMTMRSIIMPSKLKVLITGANGMLGSTLVEKFTDFEVIATDLPEGDITNSSRFEQLIQDR